MELHFMLAPHIEALTMPAHRNKQRRSPRNSICNHVGCVRSRTQPMDTDKSVNIYRCSVSGGL
ncbi:MAG: hypothetical protein J6Q59_00760 [Paludibacteraceae bacterium]|nr:hypothetical protein [Paludibacteraceae bacterium]